MPKLNWFIPYYVISSPFTRNSLNIIGRSTCNWELIRYSNDQVICAFVYLIRAMFIAVGFFRYIKFSIEIFRTAFK